jgi:hypothetical protein
MRVAAELGAESVQYRKLETAIKPYVFHLQHVDTLDACLHESRVGRPTF